MEHFLARLERVIRNLWNQPALTNFNGKTYTHQQVATEIEKLHLFYHELGICSGDRIALAAHNSAQWAITFLANLTYHATTVNILADFTPENIQQLAIHSESKILFVDRSAFEKMNPSLMPDIEIIMDCENLKPLFFRTEEQREIFGHLEETFNDKHISTLTPEKIIYKRGGLEEVVILNYTSGTTGNPKGILVPAKAICSNIDFALKTISCGPKDNAICMLPLGHMYGLVFEFLYTFLGGCHVYFLTRTPSPTVLLSAFKEIKPFILITVPLVIEKIVKGKIQPILGRPSIRLLTHIPLLKDIIYSTIRKKFMLALGGNIREIPAGGAAMNPEVEKILRKCKIPISVGYGMTECAPLIGYIPWKKFKQGSCGRVVDGLQIRVDSDNPSREIGELQVKGQNVMLGYYKNPEATRNAFTDDGWLHTGDLGIIDPQGNIFLKGRCKTMILGSNGQNIYPEEIEAQINNLHGVLESIVVERDGKLIGLVSLPVENRESCPREEFAKSLKEQINAQLPAYCRLHRVEILEGDFEHTPKHSIKRCKY